MYHFSDLYSIKVKKRRMMMITSTANATTMEIFSKKWMVAAGIKAPNMHNHNSIHNMNDHINLFHDSTQRFSKFYMRRQSNADIEYRTSLLLNRAMEIMNLSSKIMVYRNASMIMSSRNAL